MIENVIVFEDSSKAKFGGGQRVTLDVMSILTDYYDLVLVDCGQKSIFQEKANKYIKDFFKLTCNGKVVGGNNSSFELGYIEIFLFPFLFIKNILSIIKYMKRNNYNSNNTIFYATTKKNLLLVYFLKKILNVKCIYHAHSFDNKSSFFYKIIKIPLNNIDKIICVSNLIKNNISLENCKTVYNSIDLIDIEPKNLMKKNKIIIATFSTLIKLKGIDYFMKSFEYLKHKENVEYWIFGEGHEKDYLKQFESQSVILKGFTDNTNEIMKNNIDIIVVPSITEEACPMVPLEAFKYGIPVISTNIGGQSEIIRNGKVGYYVPIKDSKAIAKKIDYLIENVEIYNSLSKQCIEYSKKFSKEEYKKNINKIFEEII
ncbi:glycosyltransferase family 4 protein [Arcobacter arenosus]|uniref:glycosyltransferase family 4 protein n=1 Tax=Arcobacter arenosus TaxID=2576037 RepID=UPI003BA93FA8